MLDSKKALLIFGTCVTRETFFLPDDTFRPEFEPFLVKATGQGHLILSPEGLLNLWRANGQPGALVLVPYPEAAPGVSLFGKLLRVATGSDPRPAPVNVAAHLQEVTETLRSLRILSKPMLHLVLRSY